MRLPQSAKAHGQIGQGGVGPDLGQEAADIRRRLACRQRLLSPAEIGKAVAEIIHRLRNRAHVAEGPSHGAAAPRCARHAATRTGVIHVVAREFIDMSAHLKNLSEKHGGGGTLPPSVECFCGCNKK